MPPTLAAVQQIESSKQGINDASNLRLPQMWRPSEL